MSQIRKRPPASCTLDLETLGWASAQTPPAQRFECGSPLSSFLSPSLCPTVARNRVTLPLLRRLTPSAARRACDIPFSNRRWPAYRSRRSRFLGRRRCRDRDECKCFPGGTESLIGGRFPHRRSVSGGS